MSQKRDKGYSQKGKDSAETGGTGERIIAREEIEKAIHPTKRENAES